MVVYMGPLGIRINLGALMIRVVFRRVPLKGSRRITKRVPNGGLGVRYKKDPIIQPYTTLLRRTPS